MDEAIPTEGRLIKQVIAVRTDLNMRKGKIAAQVAHASMEFMREVFLDTRVYITKSEYEWLVGDRTTIVVQVAGEEELLALEKAAAAADVQAHLFRDKGSTEVPPGTATCIALGPDNAVKLDPLTKDLRLL